MPDDVASRYTVRTIAGLTFPVDTTWDLDHVDGRIAVSHPPMPSDGFRPNLVIRRLAVPDGISMARQSTVAFATDRALLTGVQYISDDVWPYRDRLGRMHVTVHRMASHTVVAQRWLLPLPGETIEATGSYTTEQAIEWEPMMRYMATHIVDASEGRT